MGLEKIMLNDQGVTVSYWHIDSLQIRHKEQHVTISLSGYINKQKRDGGFNPVMSFKYQIWPATYVTDFGPSVLDSGGNPLHVAYDWIKANTEFSGATDS